MDETREEIEKRQEMLKELGVPERLISATVSKDQKEIIYALKIIDDVGLTDWLDDDTCLYSILKRIYGDEINDKYPDIEELAYDFIELGILASKNTEILLRYAKSNSPIIILGESGTGKDLLAKAIHQLSYREDGPFTAINSAELTETLFESEMFGHVKGAFTGANSNKIGILQSMDKGTLFLDELGKMPKSLQAKLLRVIENKKVRKVGGPNYDEIDVRYIVALQQEEIGNVLPDLLSRLKYPDAFKMPSLNTQLKKFGRKIILNAMAKVSTELNIPENSEFNIGEDLFEFLISHDYKLNYRELENILHHAYMHRNPYRMNYLDMSCIEELFSKDSHVTAPDKTYPTIILSKALTEESEFEPLFIENDAVLIKLDYENIKFTDIILHIEKIGSLILRGMVMHIHRRIGDFKKVISITNPSMNYCNYMNKLRLRLGKNVNVFVKEYKKSHVSR